MLAIRKSTNNNAFAVDIIPCRVHHTGPTKVTKRYWDPITEDDGNKVAYFRGRKLKGTAVQIPKGYTAIMVKSTDRTLAPVTLAPPSPAESDDEEEEEEEPVEPVKILEHTSDVTDITVWGHDQLPPPDDAYRKGVDEWLAFADAIHAS